MACSKFEAMAIYEVNQACVWCMITCVVWMYRIYRSIRIDSLDKGADEALEFIVRHVKSDGFNERFKEILDRQDWKTFEYSIKLSLRVTLTPPTTTGGGAPTKVVHLLTIWIPCMYYLKLSKPQNFNQRGNICTIDTYMTIFSKWLAQGLVF